MKNIKRNFMQSYGNINSILIFVFFVTFFIFLPPAVHAHTGFGMMFIGAHIFLILLVSAPVIAGLIKKLLLKQRIKSSFNYLLFAMIAETLIMASFIWSTIASVPRERAWAQADYLLHISDDTAIWYLQKVLIDGDDSIIWCVPLLMAAIVNCVLASPLNLQLLRTKGQTYINILKLPRNYIFAVLLGLILPIIISLIVAAFLLFSAPYNRVQVNSRIQARLEPQQIMNRLLIMADSRNNEKFVEVLSNKGADTNVLLKLPASSPLHDAVKAPNEIKLDEARQLIQNGADVNVQIKDGYTPLMTAARYLGVSADVARVLLENGARVNDRNFKGENAFMMATGADKVEFVRLLLENGADVNEINDKGQTALWYSRHPDVLELLITNGANINVQASNGETVLMMASRERVPKFVKLLIKNGADVNRTNEKGQTALWYGRTLENLELLITNGADVNARDKEGKTALMDARTNGLSDKVEWLITLGADIDAEMARLFIENPASVNARTEKNETGLMVASRTGRVELVQILMENGADVNETNDKGQTALWYVRNPDILELLISNGSDVNHRARDRNTPLMTIVSNKTVRPEVVKSFIDNGANVNAYNFNRETALMLASKAGNAKVVKKLIENSADVNQADENGQTALWYASSRDILELLIANGADINARDKEGKTVLMDATTDRIQFRGMHKEVLQKVEWLITLGANINARDNDGNTALELCRRLHCRKEVRHLLIRSGAEADPDEVSEVMGIGADVRPSNAAKQEETKEGLKKQMSKKKSKWITSGSAP